MVTGAAAGTFLVNTAHNAIDAGREWRQDKLGDFPMPCDPCERPSSRIASEAGELLGSLRSKPKPRKLHRVSGSMAGAVLSLTKNRYRGCKDSRRKRVATKRYAGR